jgi:hypothetical protein
MSIDAFEPYEFTMPYPLALITEKLALVDQASLVAACESRVTHIAWAGETINGVDITSHPTTTEYADAVASGGKILKVYIDGSLVYLQPRHPQSGSLMTTDDDVQSARDFYVRQLAHGLVAQELSYHLSQG